MSQLEDDTNCTIGDVPLSAADIVVQRRDGLRRRSDRDDECEHYLSWSLLSF